MNKLYLTIALLTASLSIRGQHRESPICPVPLNDSTPSWARLMYYPKPELNALKLDSAFEAYYKTRAFSKDNYVRFYKRWRIRVAPFVKPDGTVDYTLMEKSENEVIPRADYPANARMAEDKWTVVGPLNTFQGQGSGAGLGKELPYQVNVYTFDIAPSDNNILYAGTETGGIFKTTDKGLNWTFVSKALPRGAVVGIAIHPTNPNIVLAAKGGRLYKATDGGATWTEAFTVTEDVTEIKFQPENGTIIYVATRVGVYKSTDTGSTWSKIHNASADDLELNAANTAIVYVVARGTGDTLRFYRSTDGGTTFDQIDSGLTGLTHSGARMAVTPAESKVIYIIALGKSSKPKLLKSTDEGLNWNVVANGETTEWPMNNGQGYYDLDVAVSATDANVVFTGTTTLYKSVDGGIKHIAVGGYSGPFQVHPDIQCMKIKGNDTWLATDGGMTYSTDAFTSTANAFSRNNMLFASDFWGFDQGWNEDLLVGGRYHNGNTALYERYVAGHSLRMGGAEDIAGIVLLPYDRTVSFRDIGYCQSCLVPEKIGDPLASGPSFPLYANEQGYGDYTGEIVYHPSYYNIVYVSRDNQLWKSEDGGVSYTSVYDFGQKSWKIEISRSNPEVIYVSTSGGLYKSTNGGTTFSKLTTPVTYAYKYFDMAVNPANSEELTILVSNKVFKTTDGGGTWTGLTTPTLAGKTFRALTLHQGSNGGIYLTGSDPGTSVYYRDNEMADWTDYSVGLPYGLKANYTKPFFKKNKLRLAGNLGIWEAPLLAKAPPIAEPWTPSKTVNLCDENVQFNSYSVADDTGLTYQWSFPTGTPATSDIRNPKVVFSNPGTHTASLTVNNAYGTSTKSIEVNVLEGTVCKPDSVAGKALAVQGNGKVELGKVNLTGNTFTIMAWVKPNGKQNVFSQIVSTDAPNTRFGLGFSFPGGYTSNLNVVFTHSSVSYGITSSIDLEDGKWNHITLTYNAATGVKIYLNGNTPWVQDGTPGPVDFSKTSFYSNMDVHNGQGSSFKGQIDELRFYNTELTQDQIREKIHLIPADPAAEANLASYYQFNQYDETTMKLYPAFGGGASVYMGTNQITTSTAPVATGTSFRIPAVNGTGTYAFTGTGLELDFAAKAPNGELVVSRLNGHPDTLPSGSNFFNKYWIIRNYGTNQTFDPLAKMVFSDLGTGAGTGMTLYRRESNAAQSNWTELCKPASATTGSATFGSTCNITGFSQFLLGGMSALPLRLIRFEATTPAPRQALLKWFVSEDNEPAGYELERSENGMEWNQTIHRAISESGTKQEYAYTDKQAKTGWNYYRLKLTGKDNQPFYSPIRSVFVKESDVQFKVFPVPVAKNQPLELESNLAVPVSYTLYDPAGRELAKGEFVNKGTLDVSRMTPGIYVILIKSKNYMEFKKIIVP